MRCRLEDHLSQVSNCHCSSKFKTFRRQPAFFLNVLQQKVSRSARTFSQTWSLLVTAVALQKPKAAHLNQRKDVRTSELSCQNLQTICHGRVMARMMFNPHGFCFMVETWMNLHEWKKKNNGSGHCACLHANSRSCKCLRTPATTKRGYFREMSEIACFIAMPPKSPPILPKPVVQIFFRINCINLPRWFREKSRDRKSVV